MVKLEISGLNDLGKLLVRGDVMEVRAKLFEAVEVLAQQVYTKVVLKAQTAETKAKVSFRGGIGGKNEVVLSPFREIKSTKPVVGQAAEIEKRRKQPPPQPSTKSLTETANQGLEAGLVTWREYLRTRFLR